MALRMDNLIDGEYYHIYNRGNSKAQIFLDEEDHARFVKLLYVCNSEHPFTFRESIVKQGIDAFDFERGVPLVEISAWVLMPNHFHILLISHRSDLWLKGVNPITEFLRKISTAYAMYFNKKYGRSGALFEGKYKSKIVNKDEYFNYLFAYIHLNPVKIIDPKWKERGVVSTAKVNEFLGKYQYSSFLDYFDESRKWGAVINKESLLSVVRPDHVSDIFNWFNEPTQNQP